jgi:hypothetical protein
MLLMVSAFIIHWWKTINKSHHSRHALCPVPCIMIQLRVVQKLFKRYFLKREYLIDFLLAAAAIVLFTALVYYSVSTLSIS